MSPETVASPVKEQAHHYKIASDATYELATKVFGLDISNRQHELWEATYSAMFCLDSILDQDRPVDGRHASFDASVHYLQTGEGFDALNPNTQPSLERLRALLIADAPEKIEEFAEIAHTIALLGERLRRAKTVEALGLISLAEGRTSSRLFALSAESAEVQQFNVFFTALATFSNALDTLVDLERDHKSGLLNFTPNALDRLKLAKMITPGLFSIIKSADTKTRSKLLRLTYATFKDH